MLNKGVRVYVVVQIWGLESCFAIKSLASGWLAARPLSTKSNWITSYDTNKFSLILIWSLTERFLLRAVAVAVAVAVDQLINLHDHEPACLRVCCTTLIGRYFIYGNYYLPTFYIVPPTSSYIVLFPYSLVPLCVTLLPCYSVTLLPCYSVILLLCYLATLLYFVTVTVSLSLCHPILPPPPPGGLLLGILGRGVPPDSPNRDPFSDQNMPFFFQTRFLKSLKNYTRFKTIMVKIYTRLQTKTAQKPYPLGRHISI